jgi:hypothetical protein
MRILSFLTYCNGRLFQLTVIAAACVNLMRYGGHAVTKLILKGLLGRPNRPLALCEAHCRFQSHYWNLDLQSLNCSLSQAKQTKIHLPGLLCGVTA